MIEPRNAGTHNNYGVTLLMLGRIDESAAEFQTALSIDPRHLDALINLSLAQRQCGQLDTAKETLFRVLNLAPQNAAAHYNLAQLYDQPTSRRARWSTIECFSRTRAPNTPIAVPPCGPGSQH